VTSSLDGLDLGALDKHLRSIGVQRTGELQAELISGGRSNLTFLVSTTRRSGCCGARRCTA